MKHLCIIYHMHKNHGTACHPEMETVETCVTLPVRDDIADDILEKGEDSKYMMRMAVGYVTGILSELSEIQGYYYSGFCSAEEVSPAMCGDAGPKEPAPSARNCGTMVQKDTAVMSEDHPIIDEVTGMNAEEAIQVLNNGLWWNYLPDSLPEDIKDELCEAIDFAELQIRHAKYK